MCKSHRPSCDHTSKTAKISLIRLWRNFFTKSEHFAISNCVFNFNILALVVSEILGGPKFTLGGPVPPCTPLAENFLYQRRVLYYVAWRF